MGTKKIYDLICSLGCMCAAAQNIRRRGLRHYSLPFDWCYMKDEKPLEYLCEGFKNDFKNFLLKDNLRKLDDEEYNNAHTNKEQFKDIYTGYYFVNHFPLGKTLDKSYDEAYFTIRRRLNRLQNKIKSSNNILFVLSPIFIMDIKFVEKLSNSLKEIYPDKNFDFYILQFNSDSEEEIIINENITLRKTFRDTNMYDFSNTNFEWSFLDKVDLKIKKDLMFKIFRIKKGLAIHILQNISTIFQFKMYLFGLRLDFCIGKIRD